MERKIYLQLIPHDRIRLADSGEEEDQVMKLEPTLPDEGVGIFVLTKLCITSR